MRFNETKWKVLHLDWGNPNQHSLGNEQMESSSAEKDLGVLKTTAEMDHPLLNDEISGREEKRREEKRREEKRREEKRREEKRREEKRREEKRYI
ncbi:hypothetical protein HGM15179_003304 [Zosterops borbonicus]|uniref:Uncharacterized protein n=1 Tax=Zosterops borbonicus TaxID=364589 RepID=A0A8K1LRM6_9PASS|nr:hypothetical protein HGM15179_003304 [Zosterops borbonicus]